MYISPICCYSGEVLPAPSHIPRLPPAHVSLVRSGVPGNEANLVLLPLAKVRNTFWLKLFGTEPIRPNVAVAFVHVLV